MCDECFDATRQPIEDYKEMSEKNRALRSTSSTSGQVSPEMSVSAAREVLCRLTYEVMVGKVSRRDVMTGAWLASARLDAGHRAHHARLLDAVRRNPREVIEAFPMFQRWLSA